MQSCVRSAQASTGSNSQGAADVARSPLASEGKQGSLALTSKALNLSWESFNSPRSGGFNLALA